MNIDTAVAEMIRISNDDSHGYSQSSRWGPDYDCSSLVITALEAGGFPMKKKYGATWTGNMRTALTNCGFTDVTSEVNLKTGVGLKVGDVLLKPYGHTEMVCSTQPLRLVGAHIDERGKISGGKRGDQTGKEICIGPYYNYPWKYVFRFIKPKANPDIHAVALEVIDGIYGNGITRMNKLCAAGYNYNEVQREVNRILKGES